MNKKQKIIIAGAIGDALGYNVEFDDIKTIVKKFNGFINLKNMTNFVVSDDTQMTLFLLEALKDSPELNIDNDVIIQKIHTYFLEWYQTQNNLNFKLNFSKQKELHKKRAPGITCLNALSSGKKGSIFKKINDSKGCGGIMRVAPIAFLNKSLDDIIFLGCQQAAITHGHSEGFLSSGFFAGLIYLGINNYSFENAYSIIKNKISLYENSIQFINYLNIIESNINVSFNNPTQMTKILGEGWTGETALGISIYSFLHSNDLETCLEISTNHDGDSDSTASLAGQLFCAFKDVHLSSLKTFEKLDLYQIINKSISNVDTINNF